MKPVPRNVRYEDSEELQDLTGIEGGKLLVSVLRDMLAGRQGLVKTNEPLPKPLQALQNPGKRHMIQQAER